MWNKLIIYVYLYILEYVMKNPYLVKTDDRSFLPTDRNIRLQLYSLLGMDISHWEEKNVWLQQIDGDRVEP